MVTCQLQICVSILALTQPLNYTLALTIFQDLVILDMKGLLRCPFSKALGGLAYLKRELLLYWTAGNTAFLK